MKRVADEGSLRVRKRGGRDGGRRGGGENGKIFGETEKKMPKDETEKDDYFDT